MDLLDVGDGAGERPGLVQPRQRLPVSDPALPAEHELDGSRTDDHAHRRDRAPVRKHRHVEVAHDRDADPPFQPHRLPGVRGDGPGVRRRRDDDGAGLRRRGQQRDQVQPATRRDRDREPLRRGHRHGRRLDPSERRAEVRLGHEPECALQAQRLCSRAFHQLLEHVLEGLRCRQLPRVRHPRRPPQLLVLRHRRPEQRQRRGRRVVDPVPVEREGDLHALQAGRGLGEPQADLRQPRPPAAPRRRSTPCRPTAPSTRRPTSSSPASSRARSRSRRPATSITAATSRRTRPAPT